MYGSGFEAGCYGLKSIKLGGVTFLSGKTWSVPVIPLGKNCGLSPISYVPISYLLGEISKSN